MSTIEIRNVVRVDEKTVTGGQPTGDQLREAASEGVQAVINLATLEARTAALDEAGLVQSLGLQYHHIPVVWDNPQPADFDAFTRTMHSLSGQHVLIHCAANFRVTAFYGLYAMQSLGWTEAQADALRARVWQHHQYPVWEAFILDMKARLAASGSGQPNVVE
jgi:protein tyrosine phosphatase (PTP) superfamily phosphohydrolase (DUF442 family)